MIAVFPAPVWARLLVALAYAGLVAVAVWAVDWRVSASAPAADAAAVAGAEHAIRAEATFPVARWTVLADGVEIVGRGDDRGWSGRAVAREVLVQAERPDPADVTAGAVRVVAGGREVVAWGEGTVSATLRLEGGR